MLKWPTQFAREKLPFSFGPGESVSIGRGSLCAFINWTVKYQKAFLQKLQFYNLKTTKLIIISSSVILLCYYN